MNPWDDPSNPVFVETFRGAAREVQHRGSFAVAQAGEVLVRGGHSEAPVCVRSGAKFFQALTPVLRGVPERFGLGPEHVALIAASHGGEPEHLAVAADLLQRGSLTASALGCGAHPPMHSGARRALVREGQAPTPLHNNCSGKHAGMLLAALVKGESLESILDPDHPVQVSNRELLARHAGLPVEEVGVSIDGCSAPTFSLSLDGMARAMSRWGNLGDSAVDAASNQVLQALRAHPFMVGGRRRIDTALITATGGRWLAKVGAEGFHAAVCPARGLGVALHIDDGNRVAAELLLLSIIEALDAWTPAERRAMRPYWSGISKNHAGRIAATSRCLLDPSPLLKW